MTTATAPPSVTTALPSGTTTSTAVSHLADAASVSSPVSGATSEPDPHSRNAPAPTTPPTPVTQAPGPPPLMPPPPTPTPLPPVQPRDDDLVARFTNVGISSGPFFYGEFENMNESWSVCDLVYVVEFSWARPNGDILSGRSRPGTIQRIAPLEVRSFSSLPDGEGRPVVLVDYYVDASWSWC